MTLLNKFEDHLNTEIKPSSVTRFEKFMSLQDEAWGIMPVGLVMIGSIGLAFGMGALLSSFVAGSLFLFVSLFGSVAYGSRCESKCNKQKKLSDKEKDDVLNMIKTLSLDPKYTNAAKSYVTRFETEERRCFWDGLEVLMKEYQYANQRKSVIEEINHNIEHIDQRSEICIEEPTLRTPSHQSLKV